MAGHVGSPVLERPTSIASPALVPGGAGTEEQRAAPRPKISTLLREGARCHPQGYHALYAHGATCALGAIGVALTGAPVQSMTRLRELVEKGTGVALSRPVRTPDDISGSLEGMLMYLNDQCHWSREDIARWLERLGL